MLTIEQLVYDVERHATTAPDGRDVPHVTAVLGATGISVDFSALAAENQRIAAHVANATLRGRAVHMDCHAYDDDDLVWASLDSRVKPYVEAWADAREKIGLVPLTHARERRIFDPHTFYTGILDGVFERRDRFKRLRRVLVDIKTGDPDDAAAHVQTAAYERPWNDAHPELSIDERWAIQLLPGRRVPYKVFDYSSRPLAHQDYGLWQAALCVYNNQADRRSRLVW